MRNVISVENWYRMCIFLRSWPNVYFVSLVALRRSKFNRFFWSNLYLKLLKAFYKNKQFIHLLIFVISLCYHMNYTKRVIFWIRIPDHLFKRHLCEWNRALKVFSFHVACSMYTLSCMCEFKQYVKFFRFLYSSYDRVEGNSTQILFFKEYSRWNVCTNRWKKMSQSKNETN